MNKETFKRAAIHAPTLAAIVFPLEVIGILVFSHLGHPVIAGVIGFALLCDLVGYAAIEWKQLEKILPQDKKTPPQETE